MTDDLKDMWYFAATSAELKPGAQFRRVMLDEPVLLGRTASGAAFALRDICPHRSVPLSAGRQIDTDGQATVECPYHGWRFGAADGVCKLMPSLLDDQPYEVERIRVRSFPTHEANGAVFVFVSDDPRNNEPTIAPPSFGPLPDKPKFIVDSIFNATMDNAVVGLMDPAHVGFVHSQWWWRPPSIGLKPKQKAFEPRHRGWAISRHSPSGNSLLYRAVFGGDVTTEILFDLPGYRWEVVENSAGARFVTLTCLTPIDASSTRITQLTYWTGAPLLNLALPIAPAMAREFLEQDGRMVDLQNEGLKYQPGMLWIDDIDVQAKWYLKLKKEWATSRAEGRDFVNPLEPSTLRWRS
ncbi:MAG: aromatic ring-hydroxylating dioxygenase subunit alpha [Hyphomonadaceae bacterium]|nr:aromatic ring-hydroxylating dioxygenase subunit alpha [Hyphomonadaceae bacterium]